MYTVMCKVCNCWHNKGKSRYIYIKNLESIFKKLMETIICIEEVCDEYMQG